MVNAGESESDSNEDCTGGTIAHGGDSHNFDSSLALGGSVYFEHEAWIEQGLRSKASPEEPRLH